MDEPAGAAMLRLSALARLARAYVLGDVDVLAHPEGKASYQRARLGAPEVTAKRAVVALAEHLCLQPAASGNTESVGLALPAAVQETTSHQERPALRSPGDHRGPVAVHQLAQCCCRPAHDGSEERVVGQRRR